MSSSLPPPEEVSGLQGLKIFASSILDSRVCILWDLRSETLVINSFDGHSTLSFRKVIFKVPVFLSKAEIMTRIEMQFILQEFWFYCIQQEAFLVFTRDQSLKFWIIFAQLCRKAKIRPHTVPFPPLSLDGLARESHWEGESHMMKFWSWLLNQMILML